MSVQLNFSSYFGGNKKQDVERRRQAVNLLLNDVHFGVIYKDQATAVKEACYARIKYQPELKPMLRAVIAERTLQLTRAEHVIQEKIMAERHAERMHEIHSALLSGDFCTTVKIRRNGGNCYRGYFLINREVKRGVVYSKDILSAGLESNVANAHKVAERFFREDKGM